MNSENTNELARSQLKVLSEINSICLSLDARFWLRGGWAIDFRLGRITRNHSDLDLVTWVQNREMLERELVKAGFHLIPVSEFQTDFLKNGVDISFVFLKQSPDGRIYAYGIPDEWEWRQDALPTDFHTLQGVTAFVLSLQQLLEEKQVYEQGTGRKPRPKDIESMKILRNMIEKSKN
ncbi:hypothetical protein RCG23_25665 [Neobacillus sp. PS3-34]|uniref:nucleotidyltransferase domain-containing protein n=1 Tax=Neobacillus sp. PS3-34 TaxID=3070678 RepID=UPI0027E16549|nr:hypothetical protein [Neobacillus sp. PS3-34]WML48565.1 hypothetical protein RCG23_25665 [Neobacillus sp. PS3-34]